MASVKELRLRIRSVGNIKQITRAMEMVASTKLRRFQERAIASRPYAQKIAGLVAHIASVLGEDVAERPLFREGAGERVALLLVTSDRGLCGAYNTNVFAKLEEWLADRDPDSVDLFVYGRKGTRYARKRGLRVVQVFDDPPLEGVDFASAARTARRLASAFEVGTYRTIDVLFTAFESMVRYRPTTFEFLPVRAEALGGGEAGLAPGGDLILEPDAETIFAQLLPRYIETRVYNVLLEALTSEYASRRVSMKNATDAATDMQKALRGRYNRLRQELITKELLDIVGGAEAVR